MIKLKKIVLFEENKMKFLVLGANGMAGHTISLYLKEQGHEVLGLDRAPSTLVPSVTADVFDTNNLYQIIKNGSFDTIINCIGVLNKDAENNKAKAIFLNSYLPHFLADFTADTSTQIIQMSTDCVFAGRKNGEYTENEFRDGITYYDRTKALGELEDGKNLTLRNSIVGPDINPNGMGLMNWFMKQQGSINGFTAPLWSGQITLQLAKTMEIAAKEKAFGVINAVPECSISKYDLLSLINKHIRKDKIVINPMMPAQTVSKSLKRTNYSFDYIIPDYETMIVDLASWLKEHKSLYPHYNI